MNMLAPYLFSDLHRKQQDDIYWTRFTSLTLNRALYITASRQL